MTASHRVVFALQAEAQLAALYRYIAGESSPEVATQFTNAIVEQCEQLAMFPRRGTPRDDLRPRLRTLAFRRRVTIAYEVSEDEVTILGILYRGRGPATDFHSR